MMLDISYIKCQKCGHEWLPRKAYLPKKCPNCQTKFFGGKKNDFYKCRAYLWINYWLLEKSTSKIAKECDVTHKNIIYWMKKFNIPRRSLSEALSKDKNPFYGKKHSKESLKKISGINNYAWKGNNANYTSKHEWVRKHKNKKNICSLCKKKCNTEFMSLNHKYTRNLDEYIEACRSCHEKYDYKKGFRKTKKQKNSG